MNTPAHTPTPWNYTNTIGQPACIYDSLDNRIATLHQPFWRSGDRQEDNKEHLANAELIVRAVNNHAALLDACKELRAYADLKLQGQHCRFHPCLCGLSFNKHQ